MALCLRRRVAYSRPSPASAMAKTAKAKRAVWLEFWPVGARVGARVGFNVPDTKVRVTSVAV